MSIPCRCSKRDKKIPDYTPVPSFFLFFSIFIATFLKLYNYFLFSFHFHFHFTIFPIFVVVNDVSSTVDLPKEYDP